MSNKTREGVMSGAYNATEAMSSPFRFVKLLTVDTMEYCDAITDNAHGVLQAAVNADSNDEPGKVIFLGETYVEAAEALAIGDVVAPSANGRAQVALATQYPKGVVVAPATAAGDVATIRLFSNPNALTSNQLAALTLTNGAAAAAVALRFGASITEGAEITVIDEDVEISSAVASVDLTENIPDGAVILSAQMNNETIVTATTAVKVGLGVAANPDLYGITGDLLKNTKSDLIPDWAVLSGAADVKIFAVDTSGSAAGTIDSGTVRVRIVYLANNSLDDAA